VTHHLPPEVADALARVLKEEAFDLWGRTLMTRLDGRTPYEAIAGGDLVSVMDLISRYSDPSFT
jgi:hypothetical protein